MPFNDMLIPQCTLQIEVLAFPHTLIDRTLFALDAVNEAVENFDELEKSHLLLYLEKTAFLDDLVTVDASYGSTHAEFDELLLRIDCCVSSLLPGAAH